MLTKEVSMNDQGTKPEQKPTKGYGKRPIWQWVVLYFIIAVIVYGLIYVIFFRSGGGGGFSY